MTLIELKTTYIPKQFDIEKKNNFKEYVIPRGHPLFGIVWKFYEFEAIEANFLVFPDACIDLVFPLTPSSNSGYFLGSYTRIEQTFIKVPIGKVFGLSFVTGSTNYICHIKMCELIEQIVQIEQFLPNSKELHQQLFDSTSFKQRIHLTTQYLLTFIKKEKKVQLVNEACNLLMNHEGNLMINDLAKKLGYSVRYIRMLFLDYVGVSPKLLNEIIRFQYSFQSLIKEPTQSLSELAWNHGYYDLSHMSKSYVSFSNLTPKELIQIVG